MRARRKMVIPIINGKQLSNYIHSYNLHSRRCVELLTKKANTGEFDVYYDMELCLLDIIYGEFILTHITITFFSVCRK